MNFCYDLMKIWSSYLMNILAIEKIEVKDKNV